jgi:hypothetical protein
VRSPIAAVATQRSVAVSVVVVIAATLTVHDDDNHNLIYFDITQVISKCHCPTTFSRLILFLLLSSHHLKILLFLVKTKCCCKELLSKVRILAKMHFKVFLSFFLKTADVRWPY